MLTFPNQLRDALANLLPRSGANDDYKRGLIVGCVSALCATGMPFDQAWRIVQQSMPGGDPGRYVTLFPETWMITIDKVKK